MRRDLFTFVMGLWTLWRFVYAAEAPYGSATYWEQVWTYPTQEACEQSYVRLDSGLQRGDQDGALQLHGTWLKIREKRYQCVETSRAPTEGRSIDDVRLYSEDHDVGVIKVRPGGR